MTNDNSKSVLNEKQSMIKELIEVTDTSVQVREIGKSIANTTVTVVKFVENVVNTFGLANIAFEKARNYFEKKFPNEILEKIKSIPEKDLIEPRLLISGPIIQGLAYTHEEQTLRELYLGLLSTAMDMRCFGSAHPAFIEIIKQLGPEEVPHLNRILISKTLVPIVEVQLMDRGSTYEVLHKHLLNFLDADTQAPVRHSYLPAMVENWIRLGLVDVNYSNRIVGHGVYDWVLSRPEVLQYRHERVTQSDKLTFKYGSMSVTKFGHLFANAVGLKL